MNRYEQGVASLSMPLPEDIEKRKWGGDLDGAITAIDLRLKEDLPSMLRSRLECERERLLRLPTQYLWDRERAIAELKQLVPDVTAEEFDALDRDGRIDFIFLNGEKRYFIRACRTLAKTLLAPRTDTYTGAASPFLDPLIARIKRNGHLSYRFVADLRIAPMNAAFVPGEYEAWLPFPAEAAQQRNIRLIDGRPDAISAPDAPARCAYWHRSMTENKPFAMRVSWENHVKYADPLNAPAPAEPLYPAALPLCADDLAEDGTYIRFTPYIRALAEELTATADTPAKKAWSIYEFVTTKVKYTFMRDYFQIDHLGEYCAVNLKGDCGLQALAFINLCRAAGIPARWQSGLDIGSGSIGHHDWAQFWLEGWGWLFADCSFGGSAWRNGNAERHRFYFGNLEPMRLAANRVFMAPLDPPMEGYRHDPYDLQGGELLRRGSDRFFNGRELDDGAELVSAVEI